MPLSALFDSIRRHEGLRLQPYRDTRGKLTIGYGRCLDTKGITAEEAEYLLGHDIADAEREARAVVETFGELTPARQAVLVEMAFNLGGNGLGKFTRMLTCISIHDWEGWAAEMLDSQWARQVGARADELAAQVLEG